MTLDKHTIQGVSPIISKTLPVADFEQLMLKAGYIRIGSALQATLMQLLKNIDIYVKLII